MKRSSKYLVIMLLVIAALSTATAAYAAPPPDGDHPSGPRPHRGRGLGGEVTAISDSGITIVTQKEDSIDIAVSEETEIHLIATQEQGSLQDIEIGDNVHVRGKRADDGSVDAKVIAVEPEGDKLGGKVTAVGDNGITVENREGTALITTDDDTVIRIGEDVGSVEDISEGQSLHAFGELHEDGSLSADLVLVKDKRERGKDGPPPPPSGPRPHRGRGLGGEVTAISDSGITIVTQKEDSIDITVSEETEIHLIATQEQGSLQDIEIGDNVHVRGKRADDGSVDAKVIAVEPEGDKLGGKVTAVGDNEISVENREGTALITTDDDTVIRIGKEVGSMEDISEGQSLHAFGELHEDGSLSADLVLVKDKRERGKDGPPPPPRDNDTSPPLDPNRQ